MRLASRIKRSLLKRGLFFTRVPGPCKLGFDPFLDMSVLTEAGRSPIVFDVGANLGQSVTDFRDYFASPVIHSFEPGAAFEQLKANTAGVPNLILNNSALGPRAERRVFVQNSVSDMSSFLELGPDSWGKAVSRNEIETDTVDDYCRRSGIDQIDILKVDTQGFDYEVLKGATAMMGRHRIHLTYMEIIFSAMYDGLPRFDEVYGFLVEHGMSLVSLYTPHFQHNRAGWSNALFVDPSFGAQ